MQHRSLLRCVLAATVAAGTLPAQIPNGQAVVATRLTGNPATQLVFGDVQTGATQTAGSFPSDGSPPLAVVVDPINRDIIVALEVGDGTRVVRLAMSGLAVTGERILGTVPGEVTGMTVAYPGDVYTTVGGPAGGVYHIPRNGGAVTKIASLPRATALTKVRDLAPSFFIAQSGSAGPPVLPPTLHIFDVTSGVQYSYPWPGYNLSTITGIIDLPDPTIGQYVTHADGTVGFSYLFTTPTTLSLVPPLPAGGTVAAHTDTQHTRFYFLGGQSHPHLVQVGVPVPMLQWGSRLGPLPGSPVDFDFALPAVALGTFFGQACGAPTPLISIFNQPTPPSPNFGFGVGGAAPGAPGLCVVGGSEQYSGGVPLPITLEGGCPLLVSLDLTFPHTISATGGAFQSVPIPNDPGLIGESIFAQWLILTGPTYAVTQAAAVQIGL